MDLEAELLKSLPKEELESQIAERIKSFQGCSRGRWRSD